MAHVRSKILEFRPRDGTSAQEAVNIKNREAQERAKAMMPREAPVIDLGPRQRLASDQRETASVLKRLQTRRRLTSPDNSVRPPELHLEFHPLPKEDPVSGIIRLPGSGDDHPARPFVHGVLWLFEDGHDAFPGLADHVCYTHQILEYLYASHQRIVGGAIVNEIHQRLREYGVSRGSIRRDLIWSVYESGYPGARDGLKMLVRGYSSEVFRGVYLCGPPLLPGAQDVVIDACTLLATMIVHPREVERMRR